MQPLQCFNVFSVSCHLNRNYPVEGHTHVRRIILVHKVHYSAPFFCELVWGFWLAHKDYFFCFLTVQVSHEPGIGKTQVTHCFVQKGSMKGVCFKYFICQNDKVKQYFFHDKMIFYSPLLNRDYFPNAR